MPGGMGKVVTKGFIIGLLAFKEYAKHFPEGVETRGHLDNDDFEAAAGFTACLLGFQRSRVFAGYYEGLKLGRD